MEKYGSEMHAGDFTLTDIPELPGAIKFVGIEGPQARQLADLALHLRDLGQVQLCLKELNASQSDFIRSALWQLAIITFIKCFTGASARIQLDPERIYGRTPNAMDAFRYIRDLRNKHFIHDENAYTQCMPALAISDGTKGYNIEKVIALSSVGVTLDQGTFGNLDSATTDALNWVTQKFDELCATITSDMEKTPRDELLKLPSVDVTIAKAEEVSTRRAPVNKG